MDDNGGIHNDTLLSLRESLDKTNDALDGISTQLGKLEQRTFWNRIVIFLIVLIICAMVVFSLILRFESKQADERFREVLVETCQDNNELKAKILEEENLLIEGIATVAQADPAIIAQLREILESSRDGSLDPIDCTLKDI